MTVTYEYAPDRAGLVRALAGTGGVVRRFLESFARQVEAQAKINVTTLGLVKTGNLRRSIHSNPVQSNGPFRASVTVSADANYASFMELGTRPHVIRPRNAKALRFTQGSRVVFATRVNHPGTRARPFLGPAAASVAGRMLS